MKTKKLDKKLSLNKSTITNLNRANMADFKGGLRIPSGNTCPTCDLLICTWYTEGPGPTACIPSQVPWDSLCIACLEPKDDALIDDRD